MHKVIISALLILFTGVANSGAIEVQWVHPTQYVPECLTADSLGACLTYKPPKPLPVEELAKTEITCHAYIEGYPNSFAAALPCPFSSMFVDAPANKLTIEIAPPKKDSTLFIKARTYATTTTTPSDYTENVSKGMSMAVATEMPIIIILVKP